MLSAAWWAVGCSQTAAPTVPTLAPGLAMASTSAMHPSALYDSALEGSGYRLDAVSGSVLSFSNAQNSYSIAFDADTRFRRAVLQSWIPNDPYYPAAVAYNSVATSDGGILEALVGGNVRIVLLPPNPIYPGDPYRVLSFQPIP
jgi:hypothetical protein